jgi:hypothetical protein
MEEGGKKVHGREHKKERNLEVNPKEIESSLMSVMMNQCLCQIQWLGSACQMRG